MEPRTFHAREIKEALALVRRDLGPEAVILATRKVPGRALGLLGGSFVEVVAAAAATPTPAPARPTASKPTTGRSRPQQLLAFDRARRARDAAAPEPTVTRLLADDPEGALAAANGSTVTPHATLRRRLLAGMVPRELCEQWLKQIPRSGTDAAARADHEARLRSILHDALGAPAPLCKPGVRVVALVGPTGAGKTTTIAKLAARASLIEGKRVAMVSMDDNRVASTSQLRSWGELLEVPVVGCSSSSGLGRKLTALKDADIVFVDTAGISPNRPAELEELAERLHRSGESLTVHLCIPAATREAELDRIVHVHRPVRPDSIIITKLDEAVAVGSAFAARMHAQAPLSFVTTGQQVPDDIAVAEAGLLIDALLGGVRA